MQTGEFYIGFVPIYGCSIYVFLVAGSAGQANYSVTAKTSSIVTFNQNGAILSNTKATVCLPRSLTGPSHNYPSNPENNEYKNGIYFRAHGDKVAAVGSYINPYIDTFFAIPTVDLCIDEYVYYAVSTNGHSSTDGSVVIVGTVDQTTVTIRVPVTAAIKISSATNWAPLNAGTSSYTYTIQRQQILYIATQGNNDLTGTKVTTNKPISLFSGHECVINSAVNCCDTLIEQLPPTKLWGTVYYFAPLRGWSSYKIKIIAAYDNTRISVFCNNILSDYTVHSGRYINLIYSQHYCKVFARMKVLVVQFSYISNSESLMTIIPSTDHFTNSITSSTPNNYYSLSYNHYINIIVLATYFQPNIMSITTTGGVSQLNTHTWTSIIVNGVAEAYAARVAISQGVFTVTHAEMKALMTVIVYGHAVYSSGSSAFYPSDSFPEGYGHPGWLMSQLNGTYM